MSYFESIKEGDMVYVVNAPYTVLRDYMPIRYVVEEVSEHTFTVCGIEYKRSDGTGVVKNRWIATEEEAEWFRQRATTQASKAKR